MSCLNALTFLGVVFALLFICFPFEFIFDDVNANQNLNLLNDLMVVVERFEIMIS